MVTYWSECRRALKEILSEPDAFMLGEDLKDPFGGITKVTKGVYQDKLINTSISEAGMFGVAMGMSVGGLRPVVDVMFLDFMPLVSAQVQEFGFLQRLGFRPDVLVRTMVGKKEYGLSHSGYSELLPLVDLLFKGKVYDLTNPRSVYDMYKRAWADRGLRLVIEHRSMYEEVL